MICIHVKTTQEIMCMIDYETNTPLHCKKQNKKTYLTPYVSESINKLYLISVH